MRLDVSLVEFFSAGQDCRKKPRKKDQLINQCSGQSETIAERVELKLEGSRNRVRWGLKLVPRIHARGVKNHEDRANSLKPIAIGADGATAEGDTRFNERCDEDRSG